MTKPESKPGEAPAAAKQTGMVRPKRAQDRFLAYAQRAHYQDVAYYEHSYRHRHEDGEYYLELAKQVGGPVLEYGCGSGRIALPIARLGLELVGVDLGEAMIAHLRSQAEGLPLEPVLGDMCEVQLDRRFPLVICTFNTFLHLYTRPQAEAFLQRVKEHLTPNGRFVFDVTIPDPGLLGSDPHKIHRVPRFRHPTTGQVVRYGEYFDYDPGRQILSVEAQFEPKNGEPAWAVPLAQRQYFPQELEMLLHYNGFTVDGVYGDYDHRPITRESEVSIFHCRLA